VEASIPLAFGIRNHGEGQREPFQKSPALLRGRHPDQHHPRPGRLQPIFRGAQLRRLLAAERSAEVAQEHQDEDTVPPQATEIGGRVVGERDRQGENA